MPKRPLDLEILRKGRREDVISRNADPDDPDALTAILIGWLQGHKWHEGRWREFEMLARRSGEGKVRAKVRP